MIEATHFLEECEDIARLLAPLAPEDFNKKTLFKSWTIGDIVGHLHLWNIAADLTVSEPEKFNAFIDFAMGRLMAGGTHKALQDAYFEDKSDYEIFNDWRAYYTDMSARFSTAEPDARVKWAGPDMSVKSCIIARQMEHWSHAQAIFDVLSKDRTHGARLKNVAHIGVTTYSWSFKVHNMEPLLPKPYVHLTAPDGTVWEWNTPQEDNRVEGDAHEFCQVVTQCRNIGDTQIKTKGEAAQKWMQIAQCFAGGAETPPPKGLRKKA